MEKEPLEPKITTGTDLVTTPESTDAGIFSSDPSDLPEENLSLTEAAHQLEEEFTAKSQAEASPRQLNVTDYANALLTLPSESLSSFAHALIDMANHKPLPPQS